MRFWLPTCLWTKEENYPENCRLIIWAASSEFVSSSIPSWQILTAHAQPFRGARDLAFCLKVPLNSLLVWASSEGSGETARMRRLAWTFAARIGDKYQIRLARHIYQIRTFFCLSGLELGLCPHTQYVQWPSTSDGSYLALWFSLCGLHFEFHGLFIIC